MASKDVVDRFVQRAVDADSSYIQERAREFGNLLLNCVGTDLSDTASGVTVSGKALTLQQLLKYLVGQAIAARAAPSRSMAEDNLSAALQKIMEGQSR